MQSEFTMKNYVFPIRLKILITVLVSLMLVVGSITTTMAELFHQDKTAYVRDFSGAVTSDLRTEVDTILNSYVSATRVLSAVLFSTHIEPDAKQRLIEPLFVAYPQIVAMVTHNMLREPVSIYNASAVDAVGTDADELTQFVSLSPVVADGNVQIRSVQLHSGQRVLAVTLVHDLSDESGNRTVVSIITPDLIQRVIARAGAFDAAVIDGRGDSLIASVANDSQWSQKALRKFDDLESGATGVTEMLIDDAQYFVGAANIGLAGITVVTRISGSAAYLTARRLLNNLVFVGLVIVLFSAVGGAIVSRRFTKPLERLSAAVRKVAKGNFDVKVDIESRDEIGQLSNSFNEMADELRDRENSLKRAQLALVQSEKMAAVGTLSAGLAHEVKNPLSAVLGYAQLSKRKLARPEIVKKNLDIIENETRRCNEIIDNLMQFSRQEKDDFTNIFVNDVVQNSIDIFDHQLGLNDVRVQTELETDNSMIFGNANQLQQVLMNLAINAQQAMGSDGGTLEVKTSHDESAVYIIVSDTGPGIDEEIADRIFEPFFTTKPAGDGTGLGLSVTYAIIRDHKGDIQIDRSDSGGARFTIQLPINLTRELAATNRLTLKQIS